MSRYNLIHGGVRSLKCWCFDQLRILIATDAPYAAAGSSPGPSLFDAICFHSASCHIQRTCFIALAVGFAANLPSLSRQYFRVAVTSPVARYR